VSDTVLSTMLPALSEADLHNRLELLVPGLPGWCSVSKAKWLASWIVNKRPNLIVEIGVFGGRSLIPMGLAFQMVHERDGVKGKVTYGIDPFTLASAIEGEQDSVNEKWWKGVDMTAVKKGLEAAIEENGLGNVCSLIDATSTESVGMFEDGSIDLLHVDGNHSELASCRDVESWLPKVKPGAIIVLDDTDWPTLQKARSWMSSQCIKILQSKTWEVFQKR
jgi:predicted O-methyltransferase YrrM